jgi:hypothetical protein
MPSLARCSLLEPDRRLGRLNDDRSLSSLLAVLQGQFCGLRHAKYFPLFLAQVLTDTVGNHHNSHMVPPLCYAEHLNFVDQQFCNMVFLQGLIQEQGHLFVLASRAKGGYTDFLFDLGMSAYFPQHPDHGLLSCVRVL